MKEMVGGCCVCSDDRGWAENPLVYCDGPGCNVAVHQACYGIVTVPQGNWYCRKCEILITQDKSAKARCELCPNKDGALKLTDNNAWAHVVCALYIPEVRFGNVTTMEPIILGQIPSERYNKVCYICEERNRGSGRASVGACMQCNKAGCKQQFHVTCAQVEGLLCEEAGNYVDNVKYCGYCHHHYSKLSLLAKQRKGGHVKAIPPYRPVGADSAESSNSKDEPNKATSKRKMSTGSSSKGNKTNMTNILDEQTNLDEPPKDPIAPGIQDKMASAGKRKKGGSRTPPTTGSALSPEASPRPITPLTTSTTTPQLNPVVSLSGIVSTIVSTSTTTTTSTLPGQVSAAAIAASTPTSAAGGSAVAAEPKRPQGPGVLKETRPNSIVVNLPLEALPNSAPPPLPSPSPNMSAEPASPAASNTSQSPMEISPVQMNPQPIPAKRIRSQSSEKSDKSRRSSKRSSGSSSSTPVLSGSSKLVSPPSNSHSGKNDSTHHSSSSHVHHSTPNHIVPLMRDEKPRKTGGLNISTTTNHVMPVNPIKEEKETKVIGSHVPHMLGNQLNPASSMAQKMCDTLSQEVVAHSIFTTADHCGNAHLVGPQRSHATANSTAATAATNSIWSNNSIPQTLEQLLERQWEQGSQFLMEQAQHFDIASLLSCLHQLRAENAQLEEHVATLAARRDQLLAVNARLAIPFTTGLLIPTTNTTTTTNSQPNVPNSQPVENGISISPHSQEFRSVTRAQGNGNSITLNSQFQCNTQNSVLVRTNSADVARRSSQSPASVFNSSGVPHPAQPQILRRGDGGEGHHGARPNNS